MSTYLTQHNKPLSTRKQEYKYLLAHIRATHERGRGTYGPLKIQSELAAQDVEVGVNGIKRMRKAASIGCIHKRKFRVTTD